QRHRGPVIARPGTRSRRTEDRHGRPHVRQGFKSIHKLRHDAKNAPGILANEAVRGLAHGAEVRARLTNRKGCVAADLARGQGPRYELGSERAAWGFTLNTSPPSPPGSLRRVRSSG